MRSVRGRGVRAVTGTAILLAAVVHSNGCVISFHDYPVAARGSASADASTGAAGSSKISASTALRGTAGLRQ